ncbi:MAG: cobalt-precorrin-5B (C(1))-methyltransferase CbiD [Oscillospiraceae bacterium]|nr:cobalt-precorrin-5B (C(1))-methyltransferase CbiD [Oscillospiraceae bacterium]
MKSNRFLKKGYTTGTCAAAAAKAAAIMLMTGETAESVSVTLPSGEKLCLNTEDTQMGENRALCAVRKYSGDDPDITNGILVYAEVTKNDGGIRIDGGKGVGRVTRGGLDRPVGSAAINSVPRRMIRDAVNEVCSDFDGGFDVVISVPDGEEIAKKTFNPRLGIEGGISILGTSGIVEPMSEKALLDTIFLELKAYRKTGAKAVVFVPGNYGEEFAKTEYGITNAVQCSNFIGDAIDYASDLGFSEILIVSHMGKLVKLGSGIMNTHSKYADGRMETLALCAVLAGMEDFEKILDCLTTDEAYELIRDTKTIDILMNRIDTYLKRRTDLKIGAVMFSNKYGVIGETADAEEILSKVRGH